MVTPGAERRPAWWVVAQLAQRLGIDVLAGAAPATSTDEDLLRSIAAGSRGGYDEIAAAGPHGVHAPDRYGWVHQDVLPDGRWRLAPPELVERFAHTTAPTPGLVLAPRRRVRSMNSCGSSRPPTQRVSPSTSGCIRWT